jgi:ribosomal protein L40E
MGDVYKTNGALVVIVASLLLWANFAWAVPWAEINGESEAAAGEEIPPLAFNPVIYTEIAGAEALTGISDLAAAEGTWTCPNCNSENVGSAKFCSQCGTEKPGAGAAGSGLQNMRVCPKCGFVNEKGARFCGDCGYNFYAAGGAAAAGGETVFVPGRGYVPRGTMVEPGHLRTGVWLTGLLMWLLVGPGIAAAGIGEESAGLYIAGGTVATVGFIMFIVGLVTKTAPVYAGLSGEADGRLTRRADVARSLDAEGPEFRIEVPLVGF